MATGSAVFLTLFEFEELVLLGIGIGLLSLLPVAVATVVVVMISAAVAVAVVVVKEAACSKSAKTLTNKVGIAYCFGELVIAIKIVM